MTPQQESALKAARYLASCGVPIFLAKPVLDAEGDWDATAGTSGYRLPLGWEKTTADPSVLDRWEPGFGVAAVMGHIVDGLDIDPGNGGNDSAAEMNAMGAMPTAYGAQNTPSGGFHGLIAPLGVRSRDNVMPGIDVKAGVNGAGHGFLWLAPTQKLSKATGAIEEYTWLRLPDLSELSPADDSGSMLAGRIDTLRSGPVTEADDGSSIFADLGVAEKANIISYLDAAKRGEAKLLADAAEWPEGKTDSHSRGWEKMVSDLCARFGSLARAAWSPWTMADAQKAAIEVTPEKMKASGLLQEKWAIQSGRLSPPTKPQAPVSLDQMAGTPDVGAPMPEFHAGQQAPATETPVVPRAAYGGFLESDSVDLQTLAEYTDSQVAERFSNAIRGRLIHVPGIAWHGYENGIWGELEDDSYVVEVARRFAKWELHNAVDTGDTDRIKAASGRLSKGKLDAVVSLSRGQAGIQITASALDPDPDLLCAKNGVIELHTGNMFAQDPRYLMTKSAPVNYVPGATHADWEQALQSVRSDAIGWLQAKLGQSITGHMPNDDIAPILQGVGSNGKTTVIDGCLRAVGEYGVRLSYRTLFGRDSDHPTELMALRGARMALVEELPDAAVMNIKRLKDAIGTPTMRARKIRGNEVQWESSHSLFVATNYRPTVVETDHGTWRRLALVVFPYRWRKASESLETATDLKGDEGLRDRIRDSPTGQHEAILSWLVRGAMAWYASGHGFPSMPTSIVEDTDAWRGDADDIRSFLRATTTYDPNGRVSTRELYAAYQEWASNHGKRVRDDQHFSDALGSHSEVLSHGVTTQRTSNVRLISRWPGNGPVAPPLPGKLAVWVGLKFLDE